MSALRQAGAAVLVVGLFDISRSTLAAEDRRDGLRVRLAQLAHLTRRVADRHGAWRIDLESHPASAEATIYSADRLHVNGRGRLGRAHPVREMAGPGRLVLIASGRGDPATLGLDDRVNVHLPGSTR